MAKNPAITPIDRPTAGSAKQRLEKLTARSYANRDWENRYRNKWTWDEVVNVTHTRANCNSACSLTAFVKNGVVVREEQNSLYEQTTPEVPDFNPRGCAAGCIYSQQMYDPTRIQHPMKRKGARGAGDWERISWDQALEEIADRLLDTVTEHGSECVLYETGPNGDYGISAGIESHFLAEGIGGVNIDVMTVVGDLGTGLIQSWGLYMSEGTSDDWFNSDFIVNWISNPACTHQPDVHFMYEARYKGATLVSIATDFSPSTAHTDLWLNVRTGTDAALAMGMVNLILQESLYKPDYIKEQTDLPFLVRDDTQKYLRESDVEDEGKDGIFYFWDTNTGREVKAPGSWDSVKRTIALDDGVNPALDGSYQVRLKDGSTIRVRTVFEHLRARAAEYDLNRTAEITGVPGANIERVARGFAAARSAMIFASWGSFKQYHSDLTLRAMVYLCALTGNSGGKPGSGIRVGALWPASFPTLTQAAYNDPVSGRQRFNTQPVPDSPMDRLDMLEFSKNTYRVGRKGAYTPIVPFLYTHDAKWRAMASRNEYNDPALPRDIDAYMKEIIDNEWQPVWPKPPKKPQFYWFSGCNPLRRWPNPGVIRDSLWQQFGTIVALDFRWSTSALWSDYVLPVAGWYEKAGIKYYMSYTPHIVVGEEAVPPLYESKAEFDIIMLLAKKIQERAIARAVPAYKDVFGRRHNPASLYDDMTADGVYAEGEDGQHRALDYMLNYSASTRDLDLGDKPWQRAAELGAVKLSKVKASALMGGVFSDFTPDQPISPLGWFTELKDSWPTLTGRQQFYIDHDWFFEVGEEFVRHKEPLSAGGNHPLRLTGGHSRNSIHSTNLATPSVLRLQRGEPLAHIGLATATERAIEDGDRIRVFNDISSFEILVKVSPTMNPGVVLIYNAWEGYQFKEWAGMNDLQVNPPKPNNMVGDYGHLHYRVIYYSMNHIPREVACDIEKVPEEKK